MINMDCKITLSVNAGVSIQIEGKKILVDAFFETADEGISVMTQELFHRVMEAPEFQNANCLFFTHAHKDHYSAGMTKAYLENYPECLLIGPETVSPDETIRNPRVVLSEDVSMKIHGIDFDFFPLLHEGGPSKETPHFGCMISVGGEDHFDAWRWETFHGGTGSEGERKRDQSGHLGLPLADCAGRH